jgi:hypothetical protein
MAAVVVVLLAVAALVALVGVLVAVRARRGRRPAPAPLRPPQVAELSSPGDGVAELSAFAAELIHNNSITNREDTP